MILLLLVILYLAIGTYLMLRDTTHPDFHNMLEHARKEAGISQDELQNIIFGIKVMAILAWPTMFKEYYTRNKEIKEERIDEE